MKIIVNTLIWKIKKMKTIQPGPWNSVKMLLSGKVMAIMFLFLKIKKNHIYVQL